MITFVSDIKDRWGAIFYNPENLNFLKKLKNSGLEYTELINLIENDKLTVGSTPEGAVYVDEGIDFIRVQNINEDGQIDFENSKKITLQEHKKSLKSKINFLDLLLVVTGATVGKTAIFEFEGIEANINQNIVKIVINKSEINPYFLNYYLKSKAGQIQLIRNAQRMAQEYLNYPAIRSIKIAYPKSLKKQEEIVAKIKEYQKEVYETKLKYDKIIQQLSEIFGKKLMFNENIFPKKEFSNDLLSDRLDCLSLNPSNNLIKNNLKLSEKKGEIKIADTKEELNLIEEVISKKEFEIIKFQKFKYIEIGNTTEHPDIIKGYGEDLLINLPTRARRFIKENDVLIPRPIGSINKITIVPKEFEGHLCSTGFIILRAEEYDKACLFTAILKSEIVQKQLFYLQSGSVQPEISAKNFKKILIPLLKLENSNREVIKEFKEKNKESKELLEKYNQHNLEIEDFFIKQIIKS